MGYLRPGMASFLFLMALLCQGLVICASLDAEGRALLRFKERVEVDPYGALSNWAVGQGEDELDPCYWSGLVCSDEGRVLALNLKDLCLKGTLSPELGKLTHMEILVLHNNSFSGVIPREIGELQKLVILDVGYNDLSGPIPSEVQNIASLEILVLQSNNFKGNMLEELHELNMPFELQIDGGLLSSSRGSLTKYLCDRNTGDLASMSSRRLLHVTIDRGTTSSKSPSSSPLPSPSQSPSAVKPFPSRAVKSALPPSAGQQSPVHSLPPISQPSSVIPPTSASASLLEAVSQDSHNSSWPTYVAIIGGVSFFLVLSAICICCFQINKVVTVRPWATGLSGQLQKAFVTGVPALGRPEMVTACEDFSNIIGTLADSILYKGTLSSGVEIAVMSTVVKSAKDWSEQCEENFRKKISVLSKVNHKNFMNLLGFCVEEDPFTRMMVFEYAPCGTLFEHLHIKEAEPLDWAERLRIAMGIAYCLEHMHQLDPPVLLRNLDSSSIYLTDDYAAKISDLRFRNEAKEADLGDAELLDQASIVEKFGIVLLEIISGRLPFSEDNGLLVLWASSYLSGRRPLKEMVDPSLKLYRDEDIVALCEVIRSCINLEPEERPKMADIASQLRQITGVTPDGATPKVSPLWWAELEIMCGV